MTNHRAEAERLLADADEWAAQAGELSPKASERACLDRAQVHALLAIHDTLTDLKPKPVTVTRPWQNPLTVTHPWPSTLTDVDAADRYAANEAKQREGQMEDAWQSRDWESVRRLQDEARQRKDIPEPDPLDESDHRDRLDADGDIWVRNPGGCWHRRIRDCRALDCGWTLAYLDDHIGPLTFAPEASQEATGGDLSASQPEGEHGEGGGADDAQGPR